ncbi:hypothetical protein C8Q77DRAFT_1155636 [Trametes polyzona]|nr:hypothetical protein C8Q77DRAFT_1155636 [Trametes polyzona]
MPTVPPTCVSYDSLAALPTVSALSEANILGIDERTSDPTPDPDTDDLVLVPVDQGNAVSQDNGLPQASVKPRIDLGSLNLHSPSSIVGTPFDISPRFEYPFPPSTCSPAFSSIYEIDPVVPAFPALATHVAAAASLPPLSISAPLPTFSAVLPGRARGESRSFSPTHLKLQPRDPPVPPSLVKKRKLTSKPPGPPGNTAVMPRVPMARHRSGSLSDIPPQLQHTQGRGRANGLETPERFDGDRDRSHSLDLTRKRAPLERQGSDTTVVDQDGGMLLAKPPLFGTASSETLLPEADAMDKTAEADEPLCSASPSPVSLPQQ